VNDSIIILQGEIRALTPYAAYRKTVEGAERGVRFSLAGWLAISLVFTAAADTLFWQSSEGAKGILPDAWKYEGMFRR